MKLPFKKYNLYPLTVKPRSVEKILFFDWVLEQVKNVPGDVVECGVGKSKTLQILSALLDARKSDRKLYGYDSFEGFPEPSEEDVSPRNLQKGERKIEREKVYELFEKQNLTMPILIKGFFSNTLPNAHHTIALLHLDVDIYQSYMDCLTYLWDQVSEGGIIIFDEYKHKNYPGATKAIEQFCKPIKDELSGKHYYIK